MADDRSDLEKRLSTWIPIFVGLCALCLTVYGGCEDRRFKRLSVRPELDMQFVTERDWNGWVARNRGLGPARVRWFHVAVDGTPRPDWVEVKKALPLPVGEFTFTDLSPDTPIRPGDRVPLFGFPGGYEAVPKLKAAAPSVVMTACYCSLYDDCWRAASDDAYIHKDRCKRPPPGAMLGAE